MAQGKVDILLKNPSSLQIYENGNDGNPLLFNIFNQLMLTNNSNPLDPFSIMPSS